LGLPDALGLTLAADLAIVLLVCFAVTTWRAVRARARHRELLDLVTYESPIYPGTEFLVDRRAVAYCLPGLHPRIVLSDGTVDLLDRDQLWAVIHHERAHAHAHHGLVTLPMVGVSQVFGWIPYARHAPPAVSLLLEMAADDASAACSGRRPLAAALVAMATRGWAPSCAFGAASSGVVERVARLLGEDRASGGVAALAAGLGVAAVVAPVVVAALG
jgi:Zn-dependent protease with chaperone function